MHSNCTVQTTCVHGSRAQQAQVRIVCQKPFLHPRVMSSSLLHSTLNTSTSSLSPTSPALHSSTSPTPGLLSTHPFTAKIHGRMAPLRNTNISISQNTDWRHVPSWECLHDHRKLQLFLSEYVDDNKMVGKEKSGPTWKILRKEIDLHLGCTQRESCTSISCADESQSLQDRSKKSKFLSTDHTRGYDMEEHAEKSVESYREPAGKRVSSEAGRNALPG